MFEEGIQEMVMHRCSVSVWQEGARDSSPEKPTSLTARALEAFLLFILHWNLIPNFPGPVLLDSEIRLCEGKKAGWDILV